MSETSHSLLYRLRQAPDDASWQRLHEIYAPLLHGWLTRYEVQAADADDLLQDVLLVLMRELPRFEHNHQAGAFRAWLRTILVHRLRDYWRSRKRRPAATGDSDVLRRLDELEDDGSHLSGIWNREHDQHVLKQLLTGLDSRFASATWLAFCRLVLQGQSAEAVAADLGLTTNAVYIAKSRVLSTLRQEAAGLID